MATIRKRHNKHGTSWQAIIRVAGHPALSYTHPTKKAVTAWAHKTESEMRLTARIPAMEAKRHTLADAITRYNETHMGAKTPATQYGQIRQLRWWSEQLGDYGLHQVTPALLSEARDVLQTVVTPATCNRYMAALSAVLTVAMREWQWLDLNPCSRLKRLAESSGVVRFLDPQELLRLMDAAKASDNAYLYPAVMLSLATGARRGEIMRLTWADVDLTQNTICFRVTKNKDPRSVPITSAAREALSLLRAMPVHEASGRLFPAGERSASGRPMILRRSFRTALRRARIVKFRWHDLRHTCASYLAMSGVPIRTIAEIIGHRTLAMTQRYAHLSREHLADALGKVSDKMTGK